VLAPALTPNQVLAPVPPVTQAPTTAPPASQALYQLQSCFNADLKQLLHERDSMRARAAELDVEIERKRKLVELVEQELALAPK
jgi:hypothetical protein